MRCGHLQENSLSQLLMTKLFVYIGKYSDRHIVETKTNVIPVGCKMMILDFMIMCKRFCSGVLLKVLHFVRYAVNFVLLQYAVLLQ